jgi:metal-sulfur cluster biosynthetic enzyme
MVTHDEINAALQLVCDPELGYSIVELGLVRTIAVEDDGRTVRVWLTLTTPYCPYGPELISAAEQRLRALPGVEQAVIELVWSPPWNPAADASEDVRAALGLW